LGKGKKQILMWAIYWRKFKKKKKKNKMKCFWRLSIARSEKKKGTNSKTWFSVSSQKYIKKRMIKDLYCIFDL
jgi:hypothetical protein